jgi:beta-lactamase class A
MKNPQTKYLSAARKLMKFRQVRNIIVLSVIIVLSLVAILIIYVSLMKEKIDKVFPSDTVISSVQASSEISESTSPPSDITVSSDPSEETSASSGTESSSGPSDSDPTGETTEVDSLLPVAPPPEEDVFFITGTLLQTVTHQERDVAYDQLIQSVKTYISDTSDARIGFYYINLKNKEEFGVNDLAPYVVGSAINLPINLILCDSLKDGKLTFQDILTYSADDLTTGTGTIKSEAVGKKYYIRELSRLSLTQSDNVATAMILRKLGGIESVCEKLRTISGIVDFCTVKNYTDYSGKQQSGTRRSGPQDLAKYAEALYYRYLSYPEIYQTLINDLAHSESPWGIGTAFPEGTQVFHKAGINAYFSSETDVAIILCEEPIVLCVTVETESSSHARDIQKDLGILVYDFIHLCYS